MRRRSVRPHWRGGASLGLGAILAALGCSLYPNVDDLTGGGADGGAAADAVSEASDAGDAGDWCAANAPQGAFCEDFDQHPLDFAWAVQNFNLNGPGTASVTLDPLAHSPPSSLAVKLAANQEECSYGMLERVFAHSGTHAQVALDVRFGDASGDAGLSLGRNIFLGYFHEVGTTRCGFLLNQSSGSVGVQEQDYLPDGGTFDSEHPANGALPLGRWGRFVLDADYSVSPPHFSVTLDGAALLTDEVMSGDCAGTGTERVEIGLYCQDKVDAPTELRIDNVVVETN